jgi:serine/threonine-protein kinase
MLGEGARARQLVERALALAPQDVEVMQAAGAVYEALGDRRRALQWINGAVEKGYAVERIESAPDLAALRADPGYRGGRPGTTESKAEASNDRRR